MLIASDVSVHLQSEPAFLFVFLDFTTKSLPPQHKTPPTGEKLSLGAVIDIYSVRYPYSTFRVL